MMEWLVETEGEKAYHDAWTYFDPVSRVYVIELGWKLHGCELLRVLVHELLHVVELALSRFIPDGWVDKYFRWFV